MNIEEQIPDSNMEFRIEIFKLCLTSVVITVYISPPY